MSKVYYAKWMELNKMTIDTDFITQKPYDTYTCEICNKEISRMSIDKSGDTCPEHWKKSSQIMKNNKMLWDQEADESSNLYDYLNNVHN